MKHGNRLLAALFLGLGLAGGLAWLLWQELPVARAATIGVTTTADGVAADGACTLREAIIAANTDSSVDVCGAGSGGDLITLGPGTYGLTVTGTNEDAAATGDLDVTDALVIAGAGPDQTVIDANGIDRVFELWGGASTVVISGVTVFGGNASGSGGGIRVVESGLTLVNAVVLSNTGSNGGGIQVIGPASALTVTEGSIVAQNVASSASYDGGGGIRASQGRVTLVDGEIYSNTTANYGGGIRLDNNATLNAYGGKLYHNTSAWGGGGLAVWSGSATLVGTRVFSNTSANGYGGGVYVATSGQAVLTGTWVTSNTASNRGGGVFVTGGAVALTDTFVLSNTAGNDGGGIDASWDGRATVDGGRIARNTAAYKGGGLYVYGGSVVLNGAEILLNEADTGGGVYVRTGAAGLDATRVVTNTAAQYGGGLYIYHDGVTMAGGEIAGNTAGNRGGGVYIDQSDAVFTQTGDGLIAFNSTLDTGTSDGGGMYVTYGRAVLASGQVLSNTAERGGGLFIAAGAVSLEGAQVLSNAAESGGGVFVLEQPATLTQTGGTVACNRATANGAGVYVNRGNMLLGGGQIAHNTAANVGGGVFAGATQGSARFVQSGTGEIVYNEAYDGGGVYVSYGEATLAGGQVSSNTAGHSGGGVCVHWSAAVFTQTGGTIAYNEAQGSAVGEGGGGAFVYLGRATLDGGQVLDNEANMGGGLYVDQGRATLNGGQIVSNTATAKGDGLGGGGAYVRQASAVLDGSGGRIVGNEAYDGAGIVVLAGTVGLGEVAIVGNTANNTGGGIWNDATGTVTLVNGTLSRNGATNGVAGGIYNGGTIVLTFTTVASNTARSGSGGIENEGDVWVHNTIVAYNSPDNCASDPLISDGYNMEDTDTCGLDGSVGSTDHPDTDPLLAPLAQDGGTLVHALAEGSPAIEGGLCVVGVATDQRGMARREGVTCDIGAYEWAWVHVYLPLVLRAY